jgi:hypothetical protein
VRGRREPVGSQLIIICANVQEFKTGRWRWRNPRVDMRSLISMVVFANTRLVNMIKGRAEKSGEKRQTQRRYTDRLHRNTSLLDGIGAVKPVPSTCAAIVSESYGNYCQRMECLPRLSLEYTDGFGKTRAAKPSRSALQALDSTRELWNFVSIALVIPMN